MNHSPRLETIVRWLLPQSSIRTVALASLVVAAAAVGCDAGNVSRGASSDVGTEGGACRTDGTCDGTLTCNASNVCVAMDSGSPCTGVTCSGYGTCVESGTPAVASCDCVTDYHAVGLTCVADSSVTYDATLTWEPPTTNSDGSDLTDLVGYRLYWGTSSGAYGLPQQITSPHCSSVAGTTTCAYTLSGLEAGTYYLALTAYNSGDYESILSNEVSVTY